MYFNSNGKENTAKAVEIAVQAALKRRISHIVAASNTGSTVLALADEVKKLGYEGRIVCVSHVYGYAESGENELTEKAREDLEKRGIRVCTAAHALSGAERCISRKFQGAYPVEIIAQSLRMFGQGTKVCVEVSVMALDAGLIPFRAPVIAIGGTTRGADTAVLLTPSYSSDILDTKIHEILCKPNGLM